jgi:hypothetical protein
MGVCLSAYCIATAVLLFRLEVSTQQLVCTAQYEVNTEYWACHLVSNKQKYNANDKQPCLLSSNSSCDVLTTFPLGAHLFAVVGTLSCSHSCFHSIFKQVSANKILPSSSQKICVK